MNAYLNYCIEVNLGFIAVLGFYVLILRHETNFGFNRTFILMGILTSLLFPLISFPFVIHSIPTIGQVIPQLALPPSIPIVQSVVAPSTPTFDLWTVIPWIYMIVSIVLVAVLFVRLIGLIIFLRKSKKQNIKRGFISWKLIITYQPFLSSTLFSSDDPTYYQGMKKSRSFNTRSFMSKNFIQLTYY